MAKFILYTNLIILRLNKYILVMEDKTVTSDIIKKVAAYTIEAAIRNKKETY